LGDQLGFASTTLLLVVTRWMLDPSTDWMKIEVPDEAQPPASAIDFPSGDQSGV
jgi:hypothetical protein